MYMELEFRSACNTSSAVRITRFIMTQLLVRPPYYGPKLLFSMWWGPAIMNYSLQRPFCRPPMMVLYTDSNSNSCLRPCIMSVRQVDIIAILEVTFADIEKKNRLRFIHNLNGFYFRLIQKASIFNFYFLWRSIN